MKKKNRYTRIGRLEQPIMRRDCSHMLRVCGEIAACRCSRMKCLPRIEWPRERERERHKAGDELLAGAKWQSVE